MTPAALADTREIEQIERRWATSFPHYAADHLKVQNPIKGLQPFILNNVQSALEEVIAHIRSEGRLVRLVILKDRRRGISTYWGGRFLWKATTTPNKYGFVISHEPQSTAFLFDMQKRFYDYLPFPEWKPKPKYNNTTKLQFARPLDSAITVATASKEQAGSSQAINYLHGSEVAKWPPSTATALMTSVFQCVPKDGDSEVVLESTANGIGGEYYDHWNAARFDYLFYLDDAGSLAWRMEINPHSDKSNFWSRVFIPWFVTSDNEMPVSQWEKGAGESFKRTDEEEKIVELHLSMIPAVVANRKLCWRRVTIQTECLKSVDIFNQEHPASADLAFLSTGTAAFDPHQIRALIKVAPDPVMTYEILTGTGDFIAKPEMAGRFWVWEEPVAGRAYLISADVAEGIEVSGVNERAEYDFSVFDVWDQLSGQQVAQFHGSVEPDLFGRMLCAAGRRYGMALLVPEKNNHGFTTITTILNAGYPNIYVEKIIDSFGKSRRRPGWVTDRNSKGMIIDQLIAEMRDGTHGIKSKRTLTEMLAFKRDAAGHYGAESGHHDDCVMSAAIGKYVRPTVSLPAALRRRLRKTGMYSPQFAMAGQRKGAAKARPSMRGWGG